ncbi:uncharacterized protein LOC34623777 [Cyclospora cayetanensis]|uniref:Uncharacterized protein LOC34623777 n=1 Tax=Cyclospora cayetanensis TaxID=88456 RepID=A0A6P6S3L0_9EIME|nr:uncharacterized protein LOC34623777 [Cyclospora cayetanensis]
MDIHAAALPAVLPKLRVPQGAAFSPRDKTPGRLDALEALPGAMEVSHEQLPQCSSSSSSCYNYPSDLSNAPETPRPHSANAPHHYVNNCSEDHSPSRIDEGRAPLLPRDDLTVPPHAHHEFQRQPLSPPQQLPPRYGYPYAPVEDPRLPVDRTDTLSVVSLASSAATQQYLGQKQQAAAFRKRQQQHHAFICGSSALSEAGSTDMSPTVNGVAHAAPPPSAPRSYHLIANPRGGQRLQAAPTAAADMPAELSSCDSASVSNYCASEVYSSSSSSSSRVYSPFRPREDRRSSRTKLLDALRSTGSVLPLTESAANSSGNLSQEQQTQPEPPPFPLCNMGKKNEPRKHHVGSGGLLPGDCQWFSAEVPRGISRNISHGGGASSSCLGCQQRHSAIASGCSTPRSAVSSCSGRSSVISSTSSSSCNSCCSARERRLLQSRSTIFGDMAVVGDVGGGAFGEPAPLPRAADCCLVDKTANLRRRQEQLRNPQFSDLFGRPTPSPPAAVSGAAVATESGVDTTRSAVPKEDITAHERFHRAMRSSIDMGTQPPLPPTSAVRHAALCSCGLGARVINRWWSRDTCTAFPRVRPLDTSLGLQQQKELRELTQAGKGGRFHAESRVFGRLCEEQDAKTKSEDGGLEVPHVDRGRGERAGARLVVLHLSGLARTHREEDLLRLIKGSERGPEGTPSPPLRLGALKVDIAADPITNECTGGAKVTLRYSGGPETLNQIVHKLSHANIRARVESIQ